MAETEETGAVSVEDIVLYERVFVSVEAIALSFVSESIAKSVSESAAQSLF